MKKLMKVVLVSFCMLNLVACQKTIRDSETYSFPEPTKNIMVIFHSQGHETAFEFGSENNESINALIKWFYELELSTCEVPEIVYGAENYVFNVNGKAAFTYEDRGKEAYIIVNEDYYKVNNPSMPPINDGEVISPVEGTELPSEDASIPKEAINFNAEVKEISENGELLVTYVSTAEGFTMSDGDYYVSAENLMEDVQVGDTVTIWFNGMVQETYPARLGVVYRIVKAE